MFAFLRRKQTIKNGRHLRSCDPNRRKHNWVCANPEGPWHRLKCADCGFTDSEVTPHIRETAPQKELVGAP